MEVYRDPRKNAVGGGVWIGCGLWLLFWALVIVVWLLWCRP